MGVPESISNYKHIYVTFREKIMNIPAHELRNLITLRSIVKPYPIYLSYSNHQNVLFKY